MPMGRAGIATYKEFIRITCGFLLAGAALCVNASSSSDLALPPGFTATTFTANVPNARQMALGSGGVLFVGSRNAGVVYAVVDRDKDFVADEVRIIASDLYMPSGLAFRDGSLYVAEVHRILRFDDIEQKLDDHPVPVVVYDALPTHDHHGWKFLGFGPDDKLYVPVGSPCNVCEVEPPFGTILRMRADGTDVEVYARGIRNSVGFDWHPTTAIMWFSDNGRDWMGDHLPPEELNRVTSPGLHFGFPYFHGGDVADPDYDRGGASTDYTPPVHKLDAHVAPLGMEFYAGKKFPARFHHALFVAEHGSWNRSRKIGYRVMVARLGDDGRVLSYEPFATGWLKGEANWGRPVDIEVISDGSMLISDDQAGAVYRISYTGR